jgi:hypothetical protein
MKIFLILLFSVSNLYAQTSIEDRFTQQKFEAEHKSHVEEQKRLDKINKIKYVVQNGVIFECLKIEGGVSLYKFPVRFAFYKGQSAFLEYGDDQKTDLTTTRWTYKGWQQVHLLNSFAPSRNPGTYSVKGDEISFNFDANVYVINTKSNKLYFISDRNEIYLEGACKRI